MADTLTFQSGITGRAASLGYQFVDTAGAAIGSRITSGIAEVFANVGDYIVTGVTIPSNAVAVYWDDSGNADNHALEQLLLPSKALTNITAWTVDITGSLSGSVGSVTGSVGSIDTNGITAASFAANAITAAKVDPDVGIEFADALLVRDWESIVLTPPDYCAWQALRALRNRWNDTATADTYSVYEEDSATVAWSRPLDTDPAAIPVVGAT